MNLLQFSELAELDSCKELERCKLLAYYLCKVDTLNEISISSIQTAFDILHFPKANITRLRNRIKKSNDFIAATDKSNVKLHAKTIKELKERFPNLDSVTDEIMVNDCLLPRDIYDTSPTYIIRLADQINACFEHKLYDGCAVLMRRLLEILLIQSYQKLEIDIDIKDGNGNYKLLDGIATNAKNNSTLNLSRNTKTELDSFKKLGNFAAHKIEYSTRRGDIEKISMNYRAAIEELLYKSEHKK
jgi:hypothetical protein